MWKSTSTIEWRIELVEFRGNVDIPNQTFFVQAETSQEAGEIAVRQLKNAGLTEDFFFTDDFYVRRIYKFWIIPTYTFKFEQIGYPEFYGKVKVKFLGFV